MALLENMKQSLVKMCNTTGISVVLQMLTNLHDFPMSPQMLVESQIVSAIKLFKQVQYTYVMNLVNLLQSKGCVCQIMMTM